MDEQLISKKELLELYHISYGALYRWKRKGLIPEDWFIKKSTVTGQETFFPRDLVCARVELIKTQKDDFSLDELSAKLQSDAGKSATLILETVFGTRSFDLSDIKSAAIDYGNGCVRDITEELLGDKK